MAGEKGREGEGRGRGKGVGELGQKCLEARSTGDGIVWTLGYICVYPYFLYYTYVFMTVIVTHAVSLNLKDLYIWYVCTVVYSLHTQTDIQLNRNKSPYCSTQRRPGCRSLQRQGEAPTDVHGAVQPGFLLVPTPCNP